MRSKRHRRNSAKAKLRRESRRQYTRPGKSGGLKLCRLDHVLEKEEADLVAHLLRVVPGSSAAVFERSDVVLVLSVGSTTITRYRSGRVVVEGAAVFRYRVASVWCALNDAVTAVTGLRIDKDSSQFWRQEKEPDKTFAWRGEPRRLHKKMTEKEFVRGRYLCVVEGHTMSLRGWFRRNGWRWDDIEKAWWMPKRRVRGWMLRFLGEARGVRLRTGFRVSDQGDRGNRM